MQDLSASEGDGLFPKNDAPSQVQLIAARARWTPKAVGRPGMLAGAWRRHCPYELRLRLYPLSLCDEPLKSAAVKALLQEHCGRRKQNDAHCPVSA
jgi:hypothetical protein